MGFSENWEHSYKATEHLSVWPWTNLVSLVMRFVPKAKEGIDVLELGCGAGANIPFFKSLKANYFGMDGSPSIIKKLQESYPTLSNQILLGDFSKEIPFDRSFDLIFDRAALPHNNLNDVKRTLGTVYKKLKPKGYYVGIDWFSTSNSYSKLGEADKNDPQTRTKMPPGPYKGIEPVRFFAQDEILGLFKDYKIHYMEEESVRPVTPEGGHHLSAWNFVAEKL